MNVTSGKSSLTSSCVEKRASGEEPCKVFFFFFFLFRQRNRFLYRLSTSICVIISLATLAFTSTSLSPVPSLWFDEATVFLRGCTYTCWSLCGNGFSPNTRYLNVHIIQCSKLILLKVHLNTLRC